MKIVNKVESFPFQAFQKSFADHLRDPHRVARPKQVPARRMRVYDELIFNNVCGFLDQCFPISRRVLGEKRWRQLNRSFLRDWSLHTPWFREIPHEFVKFIESGDFTTPLPPWMAEFVHYEWIELAMDVHPDLPQPYLQQGDVMSEVIIVNPAMSNLSYRWPVHRIGPDYRPRKLPPIEQSTHLIVYRDHDDVVRFTEVNAVTARFLSILQARSCSGMEACDLIAQELGMTVDVIHDFCRELLLKFRAQGILLGTAKS